MAKIKRPPFSLSIKSPAYLVGLIALFLVLSACETPKTPEEVSTAFWTALKQGHIEIAKRYATEKSQHLITQSDTKENSSFNTGRIIIDGDTADVETVMTENSQNSSFNTALVKENRLWKVDYQRTLINISAVPFNGVIKSLEDLGETFKNQLEKQMPLFEKQIESFGDKLKEQVDEFGRYLENPEKWKKQHPNQNGF